MSKIIYGADDKIPGESAYDRCSYKGCKNGKYRMGGRKLFLFPSHTEPERREKWLQNCENEELRKKANSSIRRSGVCSDHFDPSCFTDDKKYSLKRNSVPRSNYPRNPMDELNSENHLTTDNKITISEFDISINTTCNNVSTKVPKLFVDDDDELRDDINGDCYTDHEDLSDMLKNKLDCESNKVLITETIKTNDKSDMWTNDTEILVENKNELNFIKDQSSLFSTIVLNKNPKINSQKNYEKINTSISTIELLREVNEEQNKNKKIEKLIKQNILLRKELKTLKQNIRRWERRRQRKNTVKKPTLKQQKRMVLTVVNEMDISPVAKAIITLQLHSGKAPYTPEEKTLAKTFQQYSYGDIKRLKNVGCNVPSRSSIKRWMTNLDKNVLTSTMEQNSVEN